MKETKSKKFNSVKILSENKQIDTNQISKIVKLNHHQKSLADSNLKDFNLKQNQTKQSTKIVVTSDLNNAESNSIGRYIKHLKCILKEKSSQLKLDLPALCQCNVYQTTTFWDNDWSACANNCAFYKNPKEYAKVLLNLINESK